MLNVSFGKPLANTVDKFKATKTGRKRKTLYLTLINEDTAIVKTPSNPETAPKKSVPITAYRQGEYRYILFIK